MKVYSKQVWPESVPKPM